MEASTIPAELLSPPHIVHRPPTVPRLQELPFHELSWENFERLCLRLASIDGQPEHCQRYGTAGQNQQGIDIYSRVGGERPFHVYQCKRYEEMDPVDIRDAVAKFTGGKWKPQTARLVLCTSVLTERTQLADEIESQTTALASEGIAFDVWGRTELAAQLKSRPDFVDDFFGRPWVEAFCGDDAAAAMARRIDGPRLAELRGKLRNFYTRVFAQHDPGLPGPGLDSRPGPPLQARYVLPDVLVAAEHPVSQPEQPNAPTLPTTGVDRIDLAESPATRVAATAPITHRIGVEQWLASSDRLLLIGPPGAGKSTLLRFLALDLLSESPVLTVIAKSRPACIPIWVPFAYWTEMFGHRPPDECSLRAFLDSWLESWDAGELSPLVDAALSDRRLLLLVDGIDEWRSSNAASLAMQRLVEFTEAHATPLLCSSRPYGTERAVTIDPRLDRGQLAPLSPQQQERLAGIWLHHWLALDESEGRARSTERARQLRTELSANGELSALAENPLLLMLVARVWLQEAVLPDSRFAAYDRVIDHLSREHPQRRAAASSLAGSPSVANHADVRSQLAFLAYWMQEQGTYTADRDRLRAELVSHLRGEGFAPETARQWADATLGQAPDAPPLLVSASPTHVGFLHRGLLEHQAARWILGLEFGAQADLLRRRAVDDRWSEVLLGVIHGSRRGEVAQLLTALEEVVQSDRTSPAPRILLAEAAFGNFNLPPPVATRAAEYTVQYIEHGSSIPVRQRLAAIATGGIRSERTASLIDECLARWFPSSRAWRPSMYTALGSLSRGADLKEVLFRGLNDEDGSCQRAAAEAIARVWAGDEELAAELSAMIRRPVRPATQASALYGLHLGWGTSSVLHELSEALVDCPADVVRLVGHLIRSKNGWHQSDDFRDLVMMLGNEGQLPYGWKDLAVDALSHGWTENRALLDVVRKGVVGDGPRPLWGEEAWTLTARLLRGDPEVAREIVSALQGDRDHRVHDNAFWDAVETGYADIREVAAAVETWAVGETYGDNYVFRAARAVRSDVLKQHLIGKVRSNKFSWWTTDALVEGWSLGDPDVRAIVSELVSGEPTPASYVAEYIRELSDAAGSRLLELLAAPECRRRDFVVRAIAEVASSVDPQALADAFFSRSIDVRRDFTEASAVDQLLRLGIDEDRVLQLAEEQITHRDQLLPAVIIGYGNRPGFRARVLREATPAPTAIRRIVIDELARSPVTAGPQHYARYAGETDAEARASAAYAHCSLKSRVNDADAVAQLAEKLKLDATSYGPLHVEIRQAALSGLLALRRLDVLNDTRETIGAATPTNIPIAHHRGVNSITALHLIRDWEYVTELWGPESWKRFGELRSEGDDELAFWSSLAEWIEPESPLGRRVLALALDGDRELRPSIPSSLLVRCRPRSVFWTRP